MIFTITIFIEAICLGFALWFLRREASWWKYFVTFLAITVFTELVGFVLFFVQGQKNHWVFNIYLLPEIAFLFFALDKLSKGLFRASALLMLAFLGFAGVYGYESWSSNWTGYSANANTVASVTIIIVACIYYYHLLKQQDPIPLKRSASFWIVSGLLVFYFGSMGCNLFVEQLTAIYNETGFPLRFIIMALLNFILYACWAYAFICRYRQTISSSP